MLYKTISSQSFLPSAIFGKSGELQQSVIKPTKFRIAQYPVVAENAEDSREIGGFWVLIGYLLDTTETSIYRLLLDPIANVTTFVPNEVVFDGLASNVVLSAEYKLKDKELLFLVNIDNKITNEQVQLIFQASEKRTLFSQLVDICHKIQLTLGLARSLVPISIEFYASFTAFFDWEIMLLRYLWDETWSEDDSKQSYESIISHPGLEWFSVVVILRLFNPLYEDIAETIKQRFYTFALGLSDESAITTASERLFHLAQTKLAYQLIEHHISRNPQSTILSNQATELYLLGAKVDSAIETVQALIKSENADVKTYRLYGEVLVQAQKYDIAIENVLAVETKGIDFELLEVKRKISGLSNQVEDMLALFEIMVQEKIPDPELFKQILKQDNYQEISKIAVEIAIDSDNSDEFLAALESQHYSDKTCNQKISILLAYFYAQLEYFEEAKEVIGEIEPNLVDEEQKQLFEEILVETEIPNFQLELSNIKQIIDVGNKASTAQIDLLEEAVAIAPHLTITYSVLAEAYKSQGDWDAAVEVLLDAYEKFPHHSDIALILSDSLWHMGQEDLAVQYMKTLVERERFNATALARYARYQISRGEEEIAKSLLGRAEEIDQHNPELQKTKVFIANHYTK